MWTLFKSQKLVTLLRSDFIIFDHVQLFNLTNYAKAQGPFEMTTGHWTLDIRCLNNSLLTFFYLLSELKKSCHKEALINCQIVTQLKMEGKGTHEEGEMGQFFILKYVEQCQLMQVFGFWSFCLNETERTIEQRPGNPILNQTQNVLHTQKLQWDGCWVDLFNTITSNLLTLCLLKGFSIQYEMEETFREIVRGFWNGCNSTTRVAQNRSRLIFSPNWARSSFPHLAYK